MDGDTDSDKSVDHRYDSSSSLSDYSDKDENDNSIITGKHKMIKKYKIFFTNQGSK